MSTILKDGTEITKNTNWCNDLEKLITNESVIFENQVARVIRDKYPKAKHHYLILPKLRIKSIIDLTISHVELLHYLYQVGTQIVEQTNLPLDFFNIGYHAVPSMIPLHLHVISKDFISPSLKNKLHWGSFTTDFFIHSELAINVLKERGTLSDLVESLKESNKISVIKCHVCDKTFTTMPSLKSHLLRHEFLFSNSKAVIL